MIFDASLRPSCPAAQNLVLLAPGFFAAALFLHSVDTITVKRCLAWSESAAAAAWAAAHSRSELSTY